MVPKTPNASYCGGARHGAEPVGPGHVRLVADLARTGPPPQQGCRPIRLGPWDNTAGRRTAPRPHPGRGWGGADLGDDGVGDGAVGLERAVEEAPADGLPVAAREAEHKHRHLPAERSVAREGRVSAPPPTENRHAQRDSRRKARRGHQPINRPGRTMSAKCPSRMLFFRPITCTPCLSHRTYLYRKALHTTPHTIIRTEYNII
jgi:hypothetical protein